MASIAKAATLQNWFQANAGYLHDGIQISHEEKLGLHFRASASIESGVTIASAPHSMTLSYLNALVDDALPVLREQRHRFKIEAVGFFYLIAQYINQETSFWKPYLDILPSPGDDFSQPLFYENAEDVAWLEGTDVWHTVTARKQIYKQYYQDGIEVLKEAGIDVQPYTWHLFKWSTMIFASRSFTSLALLSMGSKYRTAFKTDPDGRRQAVLLDMSGIPAEDLHFPVLFPGLDAANHDHGARVDWSFQPGTFSISINDKVEAGDQVLNNYGPKGNDELLIGYGFCIPNNPYDTVALTPRAPPLDLQAKLKNVQPSYFNVKGDWDLEKATFRLKAPSRPVSSPAKIFYDIPEPLLELLLYILRHERGLSFSFIPQPIDQLMSNNAAEARYLPHIARMIVEFLSRKLSLLQSVHGPSTPKNKKQVEASIYLEGQVHILQSVISGLRTYTRSLIWMPTATYPQLPSSPCLMSLKSLVATLTTNGILDATFLKGIEASANTTDIEQLRLAGWEEDIWVLLLCYLILQPNELCGWLRTSLPEYIDVSESQDHPTVAIAVEEIARASSLMEIVDAAKSALPGSRWDDRRWTAGYIASVGGRILQHESFMVMHPTDDGEDEARLCLYFHSNR